MIVKEDTEGDDFMKCKFRSLKIGKMSIMTKKIHVRKIHFGTQVIIIQIVNRKLIFEYLMKHLF